MKANIVIAAAVFFCFCTSASARDIEAGTISLGGSSFIAFESSETDYENGGTGDKDTFGLDVTAGYFLINNLELGLSLFYSLDDNEDIETTSLGLSPYLMYHIPLADQVNLALGGQIGYFTADVESDTMDADGDGIGYTLGAVLEYFIIDPVSIDLSLTYRDISFDFDSGDVDDTSLRVGLGLTIFFE